MTPLAGPIEFSPFEIAVILLALSIPAGLPGAIWGVITRRPRVLWFFLGYIVFLVPAALVRGALVGMFAERGPGLPVFLEQLGNTLYVAGPTVVAAALIYRWHHRTRAVSQSATPE